MKCKVLLPIIVLSLMSSNTIAHSDTSNPPSATVPSNATEKQQMGAIEVILQDHAHIRSMMARLDKSLDTNIDESRATYKQLKDFLVKHETMEQKVFYPELEKNADLKSIISDLKKEEDAAADAIKKIDGIKDNKEWVSKVKELNKAVAEHAGDEESKLFPKVRQTLDKAKLDEIGNKLKEYKAKNNMQH